MRKFLALLFALLLCAATKVYAEDAATVTVTVKDLPQKLQNRTVIVTLGNGPSDTESTVIVLDGLNNYTETVTVAPSEYYCAAAVQYDAFCGNHRIFLLSVIVKRKSRLGAFDCQATFF